SLASGRHSADRSQVPPSWDIGFDFYGRFYPWHCRFPRFFPPARRRARPGLPGKPPHNVLLLLVSSGIVPRSAPLLLITPVPTASSQFPLSYSPRPEGLAGPGAIRRVPFVRLPAARRQDATERSPTGPNPTLRIPARRRGQGMDRTIPPRFRVLVVEDEKDTADSLSLLLRLWGYDSLIAADGAAALAAVPAFGPDLVLLDLALPRLSGLETVRRLRQRPEGAGVPVLVLSGHGRDEDRRRAHEAGGDLFLLKPVDPCQLRA